MTGKNDNKNNKLTDPSHILRSGEDEDTSGSTGGQGGQIEFHDFLRSGETKPLSLDEEKRLLSTHKDSNEILVKKQKEKSELYRDLKSGKISLTAFRGMTNQPQYQIHPLSQTVQFGSGAIDAEVSNVPNEAETAEANPDKRNELRMQHNRKHQYEHTPKFNPRPTPFG